MIKYLKSNFVSRGYSTRNYPQFIFIFGILLGWSCQSEEDQSGSLSVLLEVEDVITEGLISGTDRENIQDGWTVNFNQYLVAIGDIDLAFSNDQNINAEASEVYVVDLKKLPNQGLPLWKLDMLREGRWELSYSILSAGDGAQRHSSVQQADFDQMVEADWSYLISGELTNPEGLSCPPASLVTATDFTPTGDFSGGNPCYVAPTIQFSFGAQSETAFGPCQVDEVPGVAITANTDQTVAITIHGDHLFFNGFPEGNEGGIIRLAQWLADCDLNLDGLVTQTELESINPAQLPELDDRYQLGGSPITPLNNMYEYLIAQLKTQGHYQGEGECPIDGVDHDH